MHSPGLYSPGVRGEGGGGKGVEGLCTHQACGDDVVDHALEPVLAPDLADRRVGWVSERLEHEVRMPRLDLLVEECLPNFMTLATLPIPDAPTSLDTLPIPDTPSPRTRLVEGEEVNGLKVEARLHTIEEQHTCGTQQFHPATHISSVSTQNKSVMVLRQTR